MILRNPWAGSIASSISLNNMLIISPPKLQHLETYAACGVVLGSGFSALEFTKQILLCLRIISATMKIEYVFLRYLTQLFIRSSKLATLVFLYAAAILLYSSSLYIGVVIAAESMAQTQTDVNKRINSINQRIMTLIDSHNILVAAVSSYPQASCPYDPISAERITQLRGERLHVAHHNMLDQAVRCRFALLRQVQRLQALEKRLQFGNPPEGDTGATDIKLTTIEKSIIDLLKAMQTALNHALDNMNTIVIASSSQYVQHCQVVDAALMTAAQRDVEGGMRLSDAYLVNRGIAKAADFFYRSQVLSAMCATPELDRKALEAAEAYDRTIALGQSQSTQQLMSNACKYLESIDANVSICQVDNITMARQYSIHQAIVAAGGLP